MIPKEELTIRAIEEKDKEIISNFETYEAELKNFLVDDALFNQKLGISRTYLVFYKNKLAGYVTLLMDSLRLDGTVREFFKEKGVYYKTLPALKIGRLAVDNVFLKQGIGTKLLDLAFALGKHASQTSVGCRFLILDAKRSQDPSKDSIHFYKKYGFRTLKEREKGTTPVYLDLYLPN